jgi:CheY-like chemotaxis protein
VRSRRALVVAATPGLAMRVSTWLKLSGWNVATARSYQAAKKLLDQGVHLLVSEIELGDYNGLQLALRAQGNSIPAVVIGRADLVLEHDAELLDATYLKKDDLNQHGFLVAVDVKVETARHGALFAFQNIEFVRRPSASPRVATGSRRLLLH